MPFALLFLGLCLGFVMLVILAFTSASHLCPDARPDFLFSLFLIVVETKPPIQSPGFLDGLTEEHPNCQT